MPQIRGCCSCRSRSWYPSLITKVSARKALFLSRLSRREEAIESCLMSIAGFPWNWSVWTLLGSCIGDGDEVISSVDPKEVC